ncbi:MAG: replicative DNA helicase [Candidatus Binatia bacterium]
MDDDRQSFTRVPPHSVEAEESVIGGIFIDNEAFDRVADTVQRDDFYVERLGRVYAAISDLSEQGLPADLVTVSDRLKQRDELQKVGGLAYLAELTERVPTAANIEYYARIVSEKAVVRNLIRVSSRITDAAYSDQGETEAFLDRAEQAIFEVSQRSFRSAPERIDTLLSQTVERIDFLQGRKDDVTGVPSGFADMDKLTAGFQPSDLVIIAGRPSMGKTAFCLNVAEYAALAANIGVVVFSMEMSKDQLALRLLCSQAEIDLAAARTGRLKDKDFKKVAMTAGQLGSAPIYIDDTPGMTVNELRAKARRLKRTPGVDLGLVIVDYLQLMRGAGEDSREQEISAISRALKALAKELQLPVIALSQLNRQVEIRHDKRPLMADLRESGAIEQDADLIAFIYRDEQYNTDSSEAGIAEIIIGKQRNGPTGTVRLAFRREFARFSNLARREGPPDYYEDVGFGD